MNLKYAFSKVVAEGWSLRQAFSPHPKGLRLLMYHAVGSEVPEDRKRLYNLSPYTFERQIEALASMRQASIVSLDKVDIDDAHLNLGITFDDGYRDNLYTAAPVLQTYQLPFSIFVVTESVKQSDPLFLSRSDIKRLVNEYGANIGSHTVTHARLAECSDRDLKEELVSSKQFLEDLLGKEVRSISYPHGSVNLRVRDAAEEAGYRIGMTSRFGINPSVSDLLLLNRTPILTPDNMRVFYQKIYGDWDWNKYRHMDPSREMRTG